MPIKIFYIWQRARVTGGGGRGGIKRHLFLHLQSFATKMLHEYLCGRVEWDPPVPAGPEVEGKSACSKSGALLGMGRAGASNFPVQSLPSIIFRYRR